ncbi:NUDIX domain-containing protein [Streptomyces violens]|uniref:NUDIX domain-containing protein n=1 Tax=Streptomyces violens TaxID=66377 RepID=UPI0004C16639
MAAWGWEFPMGLIEADESPEQDAAREVEEETGWRVDSMKPRLAGGPVVPAAGRGHQEHRLSDLE